MEESLTSKKSVVTTIILAIFIVVVSVVKNSFDDRTIVVFCDDGQGDATYIRIDNKIDVLIDAGSDRKVLQCLGKYMPFFDKSIELAILSHPQKDHFGGFDYILDRYKINLLILNPINNEAISYQSLLKKLVYKNVKLKSQYLGDAIKINNTNIAFYWPNKTYLDKSIYETTKLSNGFVNNKSFLNLNKFSYVFTFKIKNKSILFTGDIDKEVSNKISGYVENIDILKVPHHGSKNGATKKLIEKVRPKIAVISVGKNNSYGHPHKDILDLLNSVKSRIKRTDINGNIVFKL